MTNTLGDDAGIRGDEENTGFHLNQNYICFFPLIRFTDMLCTRGEEAASQPPQVSIMRHLLFFGLLVIIYQLCANYYLNNTIESFISDHINPKWTKPYLV